MGVLLGTERHVAAIMNAAWMVRHHGRGTRLSATSRQAAARAEAIQALGLVCRVAFNECQDFEPLLTAIIDALSPRPPEF